MKSNICTGLIAVATLSGPPALAQDGAGEAEKRPTPCVDDHRFAEFDFWLGDWDVHIADGKLAGTNSITKAENGCVVLERWQGTLGGSGFSMNYFDAAAAQWVQVWTGADGSQVHIRGGLRDGSMVLAGKIHYVGQARTAEFRGKWTALPDGRVRQFFEESGDDGESWKPWFEGFYTRRADAPQVEE